MRLYLICCQDVEEDGMYVAAEDLAHAVITWRLETQVECEAEPDSINLITDHLVTEEV